MGFIHVGAVMLPVLLLFKNVVLAIIAKFKCVKDIEPKLLLWKLAAVEIRECLIMFPPWGGLLLTSHGKIIPGNTSHFVWLFMELLIYS